MKEKDFLKLKVGDIVMTNLSGKGIVTKNPFKCNDDLAIEVNCNVKRWACPLFFRSEISHKITKKTIDKEPEKGYTIVGKTREERIMSNFLASTRMNYHDLLCWISEIYLPSLHTN